MSQADRNDEATMLDKYAPGWKATVDAFMTEESATPKPVPQQGEIVDQWENECFRCNKKLSHLTIYIEDRDGRMFDGRASVLASYVFCGPKCVVAHMQDYGRM
jgi:hypothetical protein